MVKTTPEDLLDLYAHWPQVRELIKPMHFKMAKVTYGEEVYTGVREIEVCVRDGQLESAGFPLPL